MKKCAAIIFACLAILLLTTEARAQVVSAGSTCASVAPVCFTTSYSYPAAISGVGEAGPDYGCITDSTNPAWFYVQIEDTGNITFNINISPSAIRHVLWGPFSTPQNCGSSLSAAKIVHCGNNAGSARSATITNAHKGDYYVFVIFNPNGNVANLTFDQSSGAGSTNCDILCNMTGITATASSCGSDTTLGMYKVTGTVTTSLPPVGGTLTVSSCDTSIVFYPPFSTTTNYTIPYVGGRGDTCTITAVYSSYTNCSKSTTIIAPTCCTINVPSTASVCDGQSLPLTATGTSGGSYVWSGPNSFGSTSQNPSVTNMSSIKAGTYSVYLTYGGCTTRSKPVTVTIKPKPNSKSISHR